MRTRHLRSTTCLAALLAASAGLAPSLASAGAAPPLTGNLFIALSMYAGNEATISVGQPLPNSNGATAQYDGTYPTVFNNDAVDGNFGVTAPITVQAYGTRMGANGHVTVGKIEQTLDLTSLGVTTSFSSKSELGLSLSTDGTALTLMAYPVKANMLDISNTNTPGFIDTTNTDTQTATNRAVVELDLGTTNSLVTQTPSYSGNNGRNAILARNANGAGVDEYLMAGNAGNGSSPEPDFIVADTGVQSIAPGASLGTASTVIGVQNGVDGAATGFQYGFAVSQLGYVDDKSGKDDNFRGITVSDNTLYVTKGSGSNGIDTVYQVSVPGGGLPTAATASQATFSVLPGLPTGLASLQQPGGPEYFPFGIFFANATTLYVADEGPGDTSADLNAGLQKWTFDGMKWNLAYVLRNGLNLDQPYTVDGYTGPAPATVGLRNLTGVVSGDKVTLFAVTSTSSTLGDPGADPNQVVKIVDRLDATRLPPAEIFTTVQAPAAFSVFRGVAYAPCTGDACTAPLP